MFLTWEGIYSAVTTKFTSDHQLDMPAFAKNINFQIDAGIDAIILASSLGEASTLTSKEKIYLVQETIAISDGRIPVLLHVAERRVEEAILLARQAENAGAAALVLLPPMQYKASDEEIFAYFKTIANSTRLPILISNNPIGDKTFLNLPFFEQLVRCDNIQAIKASTKDLTNITKMRNTFGERFKILCGADTIALESFAAGADGWMAELVNAFPRETIVIYKLLKEGRYEEARQIYRWFMPLLELSIHPKLVQYIKLAEATLAIGTETVRPPRLPLLSEERAHIQAIINQGILNRPDLSKYANL